MTREVNTDEAKRRAQVWELLRADGRFSFVLSRGVIGFGTATFMLSTALSCWVNDSGSISTASVHKDLITWPVAGIGFGLWMWYRNEKTYQRYMTDNPREKGAP